MASKLEDELSCPVCLEIYKDAVILSCSHSFCKDCLQDWWKEHDKACPVCKQRPSRSENPNLALRGLCETFLQERNQKPSNPEQHLCSLHGETLKLFCLDHQEPVCVVCRDSQKHSKHRFRPVDEAARQHRDELRDVLQPLRDKLKAFREAQVKLDHMVQHFGVQARHTETRIRETFKKLHGFLEEEEEARLRALKEEEEQKSQRMKKKTEALSRDIEALSQTLRDTEEQLKAGDVSFLKNYKAAVERVQQRPLQEEPQLPEGALMDQAKHLGNLGFNIWMKMKNMDLVPYTPVILDPNTAYPDLTLSDDLTVVRRGDGQQLPENPERVLYTSSILGSEGFTSGSHSWEVEVGGSTEWSLGVLTDAAKSGGNIMSGLWRVWFSGGVYRALRPSDPVSVLEVKVEPQRIRVNLDHNRGELLFSDAHTHAPIHTFIYSSPEKMFPFFRSGDNTPLKVLPAKVPVNVEKLMHEYDDEDDDDDVDLFNLIRKKKYTEIWGTLR